PARSSSYLFTEPATPHISTLSLHDALPISEHQRDGKAQRKDVQLRRGASHDAKGKIGDEQCRQRRQGQQQAAREHPAEGGHHPQDRKSTRLNSSHVKISYAVFCLKKKRKNQ